MRYLSLPAAEVLAAAQALGRFILSRSRETTYGLRFPEYTKDGDVEYHDNLYKGAAGVGLTLLDLFQATGQSEYARSAEQVGYDLIESTPGRLFIHPGLYSGQAGHVLFYLQAAQILKNPVFLQEACRLGDDLADRPFHGTDIIAGAAGSGLVFLSLYSTFQKKKYLAAARRALDYLKETAEQDSRGTRWAPLIPEWEDSPDRFVPHTGLAHGVAGICLFLLEWSALGLDEGGEALCRSAFGWLDSLKIQKKAGLFWPVSTTNPKLRYHWCHGTTGIAQVYLARYRHQQDAQALEAARGAASASLEAVRHSPAETWIHCHGAAGLLELLLDLQSVDSRKWNQALVEFWPRIRSFVESIDSLEDQTSTGISLSLGVAGLIRVLLRMGGKSVYPILTARRPRQRQKQGQESPDFYPFFSVLENNEVTDEWNAASHAAYLPRLAAQIKDHKYQVTLERHTPEEQKDLLQILHRHPGSDHLREVVRKIEKVSKKLENRYQDLIRPHTLNSELHGPVIRELSGLCLSTGAEDHTTEVLMDRIVSQYIDMLRLMLARLEKDRETLLGPEVQGEVTRMELLSSDPHRSGQKVVALAFTGGQEFIYKSRSMALERYLVGTSRQGEIPSLAELINRELQPAVAGAAIPTHRIIPAGTHYGYAERVQTRLDTIEQIPLEAGALGPSGKPEYPIRVTVLKETEQEAFWYGTGLVAGFAMCMGLADLHSENLVCGKTEEFPLPGFHLIDVEMAFHEYDCLRDTLLVDLTAVEEPERFARGFHKHTGFDHEIKICGSASESWVLRHERSGYRLAPGSRALASLDYVYLVQNRDGTLGYGSFLPAFLRGMVDVRQEFKARSREFSDYLLHHLDGAPVRLMAKATRCYTLGLRKSRGRGYPAPGGSWSSEFALPYPLWDSELQQLEQGDIPYFFQFLGNDREPPSGIYWFDGPPQGKGTPARLGKVYRGMNPFWKIVERQRELEVLARSLADAVAFVAPEEPFDLRNDRFGLRVFRTQQENELWFAALLKEGRLVARIEGGGGLSLWLE